MALKYILMAAALVSGTAGNAGDVGSDQCAQRAEGDDTLTEGCALLDRSLELFNSGDLVAVGDIMNFPHARLSEDGLQVWDSKEDYLAGLSLDTLKASGWAYTSYEDRRLIQSSDNKMHFAVTWARHADDGSVIMRADSLFVLTKVDGHWGIQLRSSFAGILGENTPY